MEWIWINKNRGSQPFSDHVPLQHLDRQPRNPKISCGKKAEVK